MALPLLALKFGVEGVLAGIESKATAKRVGRDAAFNERTARRTAEDISAAGTTEELRARRRGQSILASIESRLADAGIDSSSQLGLGVQLALMREFEIEFGDIREQTENERLRFEDEAAGFRRQRKDAKAASNKAFFGLFG